MISIPARCRLLLTGLAATAMLAVPATASATTLGAGAASATTDCAHGALTQPFAPWGDGSDYFPAPDGGFEQGGAGWTLTGAAAVVAGNEPFTVAGAADARSLRLPASASATTAPFCIGVADRTLRFFENAAARSTMDVDVLYDDSAGSSRSLRVGIAIGGGGWAPSAVMPTVVNALAAMRGGALSVRLRFTPRGTSSWAIDDVFVDPYRGR